jgi:hypothetical protein
MMRIKASFSKIPEGAQAPKVLPRKCNKNLENITFSKAPKYPLPNAKKTALLPPIIEQCLKKKKRWKEHDRVMEMSTTLSCR